MNIKIAENIRSLRKEHKMTQEQFAETFGVTIGAVSKWESGTSIPDISIIMEMAEYFETSVDVLLGYEWRRGNLGRSIETIKTLRNQRRFAEAITEADKSLQKYPNSFELVHACATMFNIAGVETGMKKYHQKSLTLWERSLELIGQNKDVGISERTIRESIADVYICLEKPDKALEILKANNAGGTSNGTIGMIFAMVKNQPDEALPYLSDALVDIVMHAMRLATAYANCYEQKGDTDSAASVLEWVYDVVDGLRIPGRISHLDKDCVMILASLAVVAAEGGNFELAETYMRRAHETAVLFDVSQDSGFANMKFQHSKAPKIAFDDFGNCAIEGIEEMLKRQESLSEKLLEIWGRIK